MMQVPLLKKLFIECKRFNNFLWNKLAIKRHITVLIREIDQRNHVQI